MWSTALPREDQQKKQEKKNVRLQEKNEISQEKKMRGETAGDTLQRGRQADSAGEYEVALRLYQQGIAKLLTEAKRVGTSNAGRRRTLESSAHDYLNRAEQLKQHLAANASRRSGGGGGAATRRGGGGRRVETLISSSA